MIDLKDLGLEDAKFTELWVWDGDLNHALGHVHGEESEWLMERGVLRTETDDVRFGSLSNLIEGDVVYRCRSHQALAGCPDKRELFFDWQLVDPFTGEVQS
jgi:hypothetical protein